MGYERTLPYGKHEKKHIGDKSTCYPIAGKDMLG